MSLNPINNINAPYLGLLTRDNRKYCSRNNVQYDWHNGYIPIPNANPVLMIEKLKGLQKKKLSKKNKYKITSPPPNPASLLPVSPLYYYYIFTVPIHKLCKTL